MSEAEMYQAMTEILQDVFMRDDIEARPDLSAADVEGWDSFKQIEIIMAAEQRFSVRLDTSELSKPRNIGELIGLFARKRARDA